MAGTKGMSGGPRANAGGARANSGGARPNSGGKRPGAGRPRKVAPEPLSTTTLQGPEVLNAEAYLKAVVEGREPADPVRVRAAATLIRYQQPQSRAPLAAPAPKDLAHREALALDAELAEAWERRAAAIRAKFGR
jgi:hypothetical protein